MAARSSGRVLVCDPEYPLEPILDILPQATAGTVAGAGPGVVGLLVSPDAITSTWTPLRGAASPS